MTQVEASAAVTIVGAFLGMLGVTGIDTEVVSNAVQGAISIITFVAAIYTLRAHKKALTQ